MAALDKDEIDFSKLEKEVLGAMESEARYWRENDAKFRAVNQKVATYEEFRDIVLAAHLKPLDKKDKMPEVFVQPWNSTSSKVGSTITGSTTKGGTSLSVKPNKLPTTSLGLVNDWRRLKDDEDKLNYLLAIGGERLKDIFKTEVSGGLMGDILKVLLNHRPEMASEVAGILNAMASAKRFKLDLQFMSSVEKETCKKLLTRLSEEVRLKKNTGTSEGRVDDNTEGTSHVEQDQDLEKVNDTVTETLQTPRPSEEEIQRLVEEFEVTL